jgi:uncharacterized membrane protein
MSETHDVIYFDALLTPNRSLSPRGFAVLMTVVGVASFACGVAFLSMGAFPVVGFFGLDALAVYIAFRASFRRQREQTRITVTAKTMKLRHRAADGSEKSVELPSAFTRVELDEPLNPTSWLRIEHGQTAYVIGRFLTCPERKSLSIAIRTALQSARAERYPA